MNNTVSIKSTPTLNFLDLMCIGIIPRSTKLFVHVSIHLEMALIAEDDFLSVTVPKQNTHLASTRWP